MLLLGLYHDFVFSYDGWYAQVLQSGQFDLSAGEVERLAAQVEAHPSGDIPYSDWIAALIDWRAVQVRRGHLQGLGSRNRVMVTLMSCCLCCQSHSLRGA